jgi:hypothetical protein
VGRRGQAGRRPGGRSGRPGPSRALRPRRRRGETAPGTTDVTYAIAIDLSIPMLGMIKRKAEKVILDTALKELKKRVES